MKFFRFRLFFPLKIPYIFIIMKNIPNYVFNYLTIEPYFHYSENMARMELIEFIVNRRKNLNITQTMLADLSGVSLHTISNLETGKGNPSLETLISIADTLGCELSIDVKRIT